MKKKLFFAAVAIVALASCVDNEYVGEVSPNPNPGNGNESAIVFSSGTKALTRSDYQGADAAGLLGNNFVFAGTKTANPSTYVFDQYTAKYVAGTQYTTESNSSNWEYVGLEPAKTTSLTTTEGLTQTIKYWDYATDQYDFAAYSIGNKTPITTGNPTAGQILISPINKTTMSYSLKGAANDLKDCYISDLVTAYNQGGVSDYGNVVTFSFRSLATKIRIAFYETVPGYAVKDIQFYSAATGGTAGSTPTIFTASKALPTGSGTMTITFDQDSRGFAHRPTGSDPKTDYNKAHVTFTATDAENDLSSTLTFDALAGYAGAEKNEGTPSPLNGWIGRASNDATYPGGKQVRKVPGDDSSPMIEHYYTILPNETGANLQLRIKYTLVSTDGSGETIDVDNATAVVPAELAKWSPNYAYTYIFKISDMTNGTTGVNAQTNKPVMGLTPITLNAVVVDSEEGLQETITTVSEPSVTTYTKGKVVTDNNEYVSGNVIYVIVNNGTSNETLTVGSNANLYTVTLTKSSDSGAANVASQPISEESVENALAHGTPNDATSPTTWTVKDANKWNLVVTKSDLLTATNNIAATDSPTGNMIDVDGAKFTAGAAGTVYAFEYKKAGTNAVLYADVTEYNTAKNTSLTEEEFAALTDEQKTKTPATAAAKAYKIIKIKE